MLRRFYVDNFRSLTNFELRPEQVCTLVGPNGSGKTAAFDALQGLQGFLGSSGALARQAFGPHTRTRWDPRLEQKIELEIEADGERYAYSLSVHHDADGRNTTIAERLMAGDQTLYSFANAEVSLYGDRPAQAPRARFPFDPHRSFLPVLEPRPDNRRITTFKKWMAGMWLFKLRPDTIVAESRQEDEAITTNGSNFVSWYRTLQQESPATIADLTKAVTPFIPGLSTISVKKVGQDARAMFIDCVAGDKPFTLLVEELSEGQRALLVLYTIAFAIADRATLLAFDEPDNFVSDGEIQPWLSLLRERLVAAKRGTLVVISHHPSVVDYLASDQVLYLWRENGPTRTRALEIDRSTGETASSSLKFGIAGG